MEIFPTIDSFCVLDLKRVIYEVFCHVIQGDLRQEDALSLLSDVTVRIIDFLSFDYLLVFRTGLVTHMPVNKFFISVCHCLDKFEVYFILAFLFL